MGRPAAGPLAVGTELAKPYSARISRTRPPESDWRAGGGADGEKGDGSGAGHGEGRKAASTDKRASAQRRRRAKAATAEAVGAWVACWTEG
ncbi:uncharacterized protein BDZ99DRAFT_71623 [Mytilinidion resinicola]|uniref:Uncharacterized protein n=1 Tax=Mytilinidion resinicola TaxID=574789 RepID=A0A6A6YGV5_9PEZI|nr:uncharacterized protein BDZ99DRAFT_71623 [Mytilinidion resinicola]KAF2808031.1 hypothetical protein BDZ99DRAFT_71623 [Mytilinidion resinicola]